ncbi:MAG: hypothetical protein IPK94_06105 [Saprospiraceae bacterium]|nr:hypothetical protein [Saprospiraceae bacterium]
MVEKEKGSSRKWIPLAIQSFKRGYELFSHHFVAICMAKNGTGRYPWPCPSLVGSLTGSWGTKIDSSGWSWMDWEGPILVDGKTLGSNTSSCRGTAVSLI